MCVFALHVAFVCSFFSNTHFCAIFFREEVIYTRTCTSFSCLWHKLNYFTLLTKFCKIFSTVAHMRAQNACRHRTMLAAIHTRFAYNGQNQAKEDKRKVKKKCKRRICSLFFHSLLLCHQFFFTIFSFEICWVTRICCKSCVAVCAFQLLLSSFFYCLSISDNNGSSLCQTVRRMFWVPFTICIGRNDVGMKSNTRIQCIIHQRTLIHTRMQLMSCRTLYHRVIWSKISILSWLIRSLLRRLERRRRRRKCEEEEKNIYCWVKRKPAQTIFLLKSVAFSIVALIPFLIAFISADYICVHMRVSWVGLCVSGCLWHCDSTRLMGEPEHIRFFYIDLQTHHCLVEHVEWMRKYMLYMHQPSDSTHCVMHVHRSYWTISITL